MRKTLPDEVRLPDDVCPKRYRITLKPDLERLTFSGNESVDIDVRVGTPRVVLHAAELEIRSVVLERDGVSCEPRRIETNEEEETVTLVFSRPLEPGGARLLIDFAGQLNDNMRGFYRSVYRVDGEERHMAVTQFEATDARRAFPCWDEPSLKAVFEVTLVVPEDRVAISNMPPSHTESGEGGLKTVRFAETPVMSTYLLAFIVGEFDHVETQTEEGVTVRVYTPVGRREQGRFALEVAARSLSFFHEYFGIAYPLPKMDLLAIPDFEAGAMENWGCVTYREITVLLDPEESSAATRQRVAIVVAHELAHQWFGNLVTMQWWTHLWLNEGFASWISYLAVDHLFPEWEIWQQFVFTDTAPAMVLDALNSSHPIEVDVHHPREISEIFDAISYSKGASVLRMLNAYLGGDTFRRGLQRYLRRHQFSNATTEDLWQALAEESGQRVKQVMDTWTKQTGYPLLSADSRQGEVKLRQARYSLDGAAHPDDTSRWSVPVGVRTEGKQDVFRLLEDAEASIGAGDAGWVKLNPDQLGFYRTNYSSELWDRMAAAVETGALPATDRLGLENDAFALARAGYLGAPRALSLAMAYRGETDCTVWSDLTENLKAYDFLLAAQPAVHGLFRAFVRSLYGAIHERLGWDSPPDEDHLTRLLRAKVIDALRRYGHREVIGEALRRFDGGNGQGTTVAPDLRGTVYAAVVERRGADGYEAVLGIYRGAELHEEKIRALQALGSGAGPDLLWRALEFSLSAEVRSQDTPLALDGITANPFGRQAAWDFLRANWKEFYRRYGQGFIIARIVSRITQNFTTPDHAREVRAFFDAHPAPAAARAVSQSIEQIEANARWLQRDGAAIEEWLNGQVQPG